MIAVLSALLTPAIAFLAVVVAVAQWWIARNKLKLDLFERRWTVYEALGKVLRQMGENGNVSDEERREFMYGTRAYQWLFNRRIAGFIRTTQYNAILLSALTAELGHEIAQTRRQAISVRRSEIIKWAIDQFPVEVDKMFKRSMAIRH